MAKKDKVNRGDQYRAIMEKTEYGIMWFLSFVFKYQIQIELFHYCLMCEKTAYFLFDCWEKYVNVLAPKDEQNAAVIVAIAAKNGGEKTTPNLR